MGDTVYLIGGRGEDAIHPVELARWADSIPYEVWVGISKRVPRIYPGLDAAELGLTEQGCT